MIVYLICSHTVFGQPISQNYETEWFENSDIRLFSVGTKEAFSDLKVSVCIDNFTIWGYVSSGLDLMPLFSTMVVSRL